MTIRTTRPRPVAPLAIKRVHSTPTGATDGNIIAAIITTHTPRKGSSARPMVPDPLPISLAKTIVTAHATTASAATAIHGTTSWRGGRACNGPVTAAGSAWLLIAVLRSALVPELGDETVCAGEIGAPVAVVADIFRPGLPDWLGDGAERRVRDHGRFLAIHSHQLVAAHRQRARDLGVQRAIGLLERDRCWLHTGDLADQRSQPGEVAAGTAGKHRPQGLALFSGSAVVQVQRNLPAAIGHPLRRVDGHDCV